MIMYLYVIYMMMLSLMSLIISFYFLINKIVYMLELEILKLITVNLIFFILLDWISMMFMSVVLLISSMVIFYSIEYMMYDKKEMKNRFMFMMLMFVFSMILMVLSPNFISILFGWDGLGLVSFCLILFYQNENSFNSGMITVLMNRVGDIMILMVIGLSMSLGSWSFINFSEVSNLMILMIFIASITKSAQIPFSLWLPMAMAAPTPVSSLVHSSTLVTAGVYLLMRFGGLMNDNILIMKLMMFMSVLTMFMSGMGANFEMDVKKIIALSTLSQLGVMIFCLSLNFYEGAYFHLITHAMFKSMLFMCAGAIIHNMGDWQDIRMMNLIYYHMPLVGIMFNCSSLSLCGTPFLSGFYSKDLILEMYLMSMFNKVMFLIVFFSMGLTVSYTVRLMYYTFLNSSKFKLFNYYFMFEGEMIVSMVILFFMSVSIGSALSWLLFSMKNYIIMNLKFKLIIYLFMFMGFMMGNYSILLFKSKLFFYNLNEIYCFFSNMWFMFSMFKLISSLILLGSLSIVYKIEMGWNEYFLGGEWKFLIKFYPLILMNNKYFNLMILMFYMLLLLLMMI